MTKNFYKSLLENISDGILLIDKEGIVSFANISLSNILGVYIDLKGKSIHQIHALISYEDIKKAWLEIIPNLYDQAFRKLNIVKKDTLSFTIEFRIQNMLNLEGLDSITIIVKEDPIEYDHYKVFEESQERIWMQNEALKELSKSSFWATNNINECFSAINSIAAERLKVSRASVWLLKDGYLKCQKLLDSQQCIISPLKIKASDYPFYFESLNKSQIIDADNVATDERTKEFSLNYHIPLGITSVLDVPIHMNGALIGVLSLEHTGAMRKWHMEEKTFASSLADTAALAVASSERKLAMEDLEVKVKEQEKTLDLFKKYVPSTVFHKILEAGNTESLFEGELRSAAVLFCDLRNFTSISENIYPKDVVSLLNAYYRIMSDVIKKNNGAINQYVGDEIFAAFGVPVSYSNNEENAVRCALEMVNKLEKLNEFFLNKTGRTIELGIGINTGMVIAGNLGSEDKIEYSITGDTVNTGKRIEQLTKTSPNKVYISSSTYEKVKNLFSVKALPAVMVQGKSTKLIVYEVLGSL